MLSRRLRRTAIFFGIIAGYIGIQIFVVHEIHQGLGLGREWVWPLAGWVVAMTFFPVLLWRLEHRGYHRLATAGAWLGYGWMGFAFLFFWIALAVTGVSMFDSDLLATIGIDTFSLSMLLTALVVAYGVYAATRPRVERVMMTSRKIPATDLPVRLVLVTDVHLGALVGQRALRRLIRRIEQLKPDAVLSAGDLVDGQADRLSRLHPMLAAIQPRLGKYAVTGNHEFYVGLDHALDFHQRAGFRVLRGESVEITPSISILGVDDPTGRGASTRNTFDEGDTLQQIPPARFTVLLKHQPVATAGTARRADLQLSGHVHKGQIFPFNFLVRLVYRYSTGIHALPGGGQLYVSRGTGTWGPPMRILAPGEITLIEISGSLT